jgi:hypothetical protein
MEERKQASKHTSLPRAGLETGNASVLIVQACSNLAAMWINVAKL